jgi:hypothetical protein
LFTTYLSFTGACGVGAGACPRANETRARTAQTLRIEVFMAVSPESGNDAEGITACRKRGEKRAREGKEKSEIGRFLQLKSENSKS